MLEALRSVNAGASEVRTRPNQGVVDNDQTAMLLRRWHGGDRCALDLLVERDLGWVLGHVRRRIGPALRRKTETVDMVQDAMLEVLRYTPRFALRRRDQFRALVARIVENVLRDRSDFFRAKRRALSSECDSPGALELDQLGGGAACPSSEASVREEIAWVRRGLELIDEESRQVILLRLWENCSFVDIGQTLGVGENTARMRFRRALPKLARRIAELKSGRLVSSLMAASS